MNSSTAMRLGFGFENLKLTWFELLSHMFANGDSLCARSGRRVKIQQLNETFIMSFGNRPNRLAPLIIEPTLDLSVHCDPVLLKTLNEKEILKYIPIVSEVLSTSNIPTVLFNIISEYAVEPARYSLESIILRNSSLLIKKQKQHTNTNLDKEWWLISLDGSCSGPINQQAIYTTDSQTVANVSLPLLYATTLRYQLVE
jgi:hypothetical protein